MFFSTRNYETLTRWTKILSYRFYGMRIFMLKAIKSRRERWKAYTNKLNIYITHTIFLGKGKSVIDAFCEALE